MSSYRAFLLTSAALACTPCAAIAASAPADEQQVGTLEEVVVTARRREEVLSRVPVAVAAFSGDKLADENVHSTQDLQRLVPGVVLGDTGSPVNPAFSIRGQGKFGFGGALPSVLSYFNEVPLGSNNSVLPTYDLSNAQVLKGPQGTLFGRNTTGGAILVYSQVPKYEFGGYVEGIYGSYNWRNAQGAINVPIVPDKLAVRLAGDFARRDGYIKNVGVGDDLGGLRTEAYRVSVLFEPTDFIKNTTVYDHFHINQTARYALADGAFTAPDGKRQYQLIAQQYAGLDALFGTNSGGWPLCGRSSNCDVDLAIKEQLALGSRARRTPFTPYVDGLVEGVSNTTTVELGVVTFKNIFGWRQDHSTNVDTADGMPFSLVQTNTIKSNRQFSDEPQLSGTSLEGALDWVAGLFYIQNTMPGPAYLTFDAYRNPTWYPTPDSPTPNLVTLFPTPGVPAGTPMSALLGPFNPGSVQMDQFFTDTSRAGYAQANYRFDGKLEGLSFTAGIRYTSDSQEGCAENFQPINSPPLQGMEACKVAAGASVNNATSNALTWTVGLDDKISDNLFVYVVGRKGYKGGGVNTPQLGGVFEPFQSYRPQTVTDVEIGVKTHWSAGSWIGSFNLAAFNSDYDDLIRFVPGLPPNADRDNNPRDDPSGGALFINGKTATARGVEIDGVVAPFPDLTLGFSGSYLDYRIADAPVPAAFAGFPVNGADNAPKWSYTLSGDYRLPFGDSTLGQFVVHADYYWTDHYMYGTGFLPSYGVVNLNLDWRDIGGEPLTLSLFVMNAADEVYLNSVTFSGTAPGFSTVSYGEPRMIGLRARYKFGGG